jgi:hypothetical protein
MGSVLGVGDDRSQKTYTPSPITYPTDSRGRRISFIPAVICGATSLSVDPERPVLADINDVSYSMYRTSADLEHARHFTAMPQYWATGVEPNEVESLAIGSSAIRESSKHGLIGTIAQNAGAALAHALKVAAVLMGESPDEVDFQFNRDFFEAPLDSSAFLALLEGWSRGALSSKDLFYTFHKREVLDPTEDPSEAISRMEKFLAEWKASQEKQADRSANPQDNRTQQTQ